LRVGILGTGNVGQVLGTGFVKLGHDVKIGSRDPSKMKAWVAKNGVQASAGTFAEAASFAEIAVLATLWAGTENALYLAGPENFAGKIVIDTTNPLSSAKPGGRLSLTLGFSDSAGEEVQRWLPKSHVVKAFNIVGNAHMFRPEFPNGPPDMFICGNDARAKSKVAEILSAFGWPTIDIGGIEEARLLEPLAMLWITYALQRGTWNHAFKLLRKTQ
jgi:hypothetical protein